MSGSTPATKPVHTIVLDAGPLLKNIPPLSTLLAQSEELATTPSVINEIRDPDARARVETLYLPFLKQRTPTPKSISVISEFARKTGDRAVLSKVDIEILALAYELECERNGGDWRLRSVPGQKRVNGKPPVKEETKVEELTKELENTTLQSAETPVLEENEKNGSPATEEQTSPEQIIEPQSAEEAEEAEDDEESDGGEWITPSNLKKKQARDEGSAAITATEPKVMQVATMTTDFACQNVLLQMNLNLLSTTTLQRIQHLKTYIKRCHACFATTKDMSKQFCPRCGKDTLTRVSCSTNASGEFKMHLKKNMQWNTRGDKYSIPKPVHGSASGKWKGGGGQGGWGTGLILAEDQKEYVKARTEEQRRLRKERDLMDEDYLPGILTGERHRTGGRIKVGAGRSVNSRKR
ncbi:hypothetical protein DTO195F2_6302 [Paecilomyces variotii]|nr:hypothetical protein DTO195F2_6302 [Paecilomyces variotii]